MRLHPFGDVGTSLIRDTIFPSKFGPLKGTANAFIGSFEIRLDCSLLSSQGSWYSMSLARWDGTRSNNESLGHSEGGGRPDCRAYAEKASLSESSHTASLWDASLDLFDRKSSSSIFTALSLYDTLSF